MRERIHELARRVRDLPTLPAIYQQVEAVTRDPAASSARLAEIIGHDPIFTVRLLRVANSARYAPTERVTTVTRAVSILGHRAVRETVLVTSVITLLPQQEDRRRQAEAFWRHALGVGAASRVVVAASPVGALLPREECLVAGLLHDLGRLIWLRFFPEELQAITAAAEQSGLTLLEAELALTGTTHARLGRMVARHWRLPESYQEVIGAHHDTALGGRDALLCGVVQVADALAHVLELGGPALSRVPSPARETWEALRLSPEQMPELLDTTLAEFQQTLEEFPLFPGDVRSAAREPNAVVAAPGPS